MKLLYITNGINGSGGLERVLSIKASYLAEHYNYEVIILSLNEPETKPFYLFSDKIQFISIPVKGNLFYYVWSYVKGLRKIMNEILPDVISVCDDGLKGFFVPGITGKKVPVVYERHASIVLNTSNSIKGKIIKFLMKSQIRHFEKFIVLTESNCKEWNKDNVIVIPNPLSFYPEKSSSLTEKKVIVVGSHSYNKGYDLLLQIWKIVSDIHPDWELHIYGKIDANKTFIEMAEKMHLNKSVYFHLPVNDIQTAYLESSIMLLPSRSEGFGMVLIEAMACGLPCVSFDCPSGPFDIIIDGEDGFLVSIENTKEFADIVIYLISNEPERIRIGKNAKQNVKRYLPENIVLQWDTLFKELVGRYGK